MVQTRAQEKRKGAIAQQPTVNGVTFPQLMTIYSAIVDDNREILSSVIKPIEKIDFYFDVYKDNCEPVGFPPTTAKDAQRVIVKRSLLEMAYVMGHVNCVRALISEHKADLLLLIPSMFSILTEHDLSSDSEMSCDSDDDDFYDHDSSKSVKGVMDSKSDYETLLWVMLAAISALEKLKPEAVAAACAAIKPGGTDSETEFDIKEVEQAVRVSLAVSSGPGLFATQQEQVVQEGCLGSLSREMKR